MAFIRVNPEREQRERDAQSEAQAARQRYEQLIRGGGFNLSDDDLRRANAFNYGTSIGQREFEQDPEMQRLKRLRDQYAQGFNSDELSGIRAEARGQVAGQAAADQRRLVSNLGRGGVGGARAAAIRNQSAMQSQSLTNEVERKLAVDSAQMQRQGVNDLQDFIFRQKLGKLGTGAAFAQMGSADYAAQQARMANQGGGKK